MTTRCLLAIVALLAAGPGCGSSPRGASTAPAAPRVETSAATEPAPAPRQPRATAADATADYPIEPASAAPTAPTTPTAATAAPATMPPPAGAGASPAVRGWLSWRGPDQNGTSAERGLPDAWTPGGENDLWSIELAGRGTPVIAEGRVYTGGYAGTGAELQELLVCLDERTGRTIWEERFNDFISDVIYNRYSIGSPTVDAETGNVYYLTAAGLLNAFTRDGDPLWQHSMMEEFGRLTFPNGRTGSPVIDDDLVIIHVISASWGPLGPAADRFYAFDKTTGAPAWISTPGKTPNDSSFCMPVLAWQDGRRVLYATTGCGHVVCIDARTGETIWRYRMSIGGMNSAVVLTGERLVAVHGKENLDSSEIGRMVALPLGTEPTPGTEGPVELQQDDELWRTHLCAFTSSPVLAGDRVYLTDATGELCSVDVATGTVLWKHKLAPDQIHASPLYADGKLYVPMNNGTFWIIRPTDDGPEILEELQLEGNCLGAPSAWNGKVYVHTTERLYCFGSETGMPPASRAAEARPTSGGPVTQLQVVPCDVLISPGERVPLAVNAYDAKGRLVRTSVAGAQWKPGRGPAVDANVDRGTLVVAADAKPGTGVLTVSSPDGATGSLRVRIVPDGAFVEDFESYALTVPDEAEPGTKVAFPPSHWLAARPKWRVRQRDGSQVLAKTLDNPLFQRTFSMIGDPGMASYTAQMDIRSDGTRRMMSSAGVVNQRYLIALKGNHQEIEISSNDERVKEGVRFRWQPDVWYTLKSRVDLQPDGSAVVRAKAWPRDEAEPDAWNLEYVHRIGHTHGAPGIWGFSPQSRFSVYLDNLSVTPNE